MKIFIHKRPVATTWLKTVVQTSYLNSTLIRRLGKRLFPASTQRLWSTMKYSQPANQQHGQPTGAFSWRPVLRLSPEHRPMLTRTYPELRTCEGVIVVSALHSGRALASPDMRPAHSGFVPHAYQPPPPPLPPPNPP